MVLNGLINPGNFVLQINIDWNQILEEVINGALIALVVAIILLIGYLVGWLAKKGTVYILRKTVDPAMANTELGQTLQRSSVDLTSIVGSLVLAFVMSIAFIVAVNYMGMSGDVGTVLKEVALYLPKLIGGIIVLTVGIILVGLLAKYIEILLKGVFEKKYEDLSKLISNLILIGLVAFVITLGLNIMELQGDLVYPLILGTVIIGAGAIIGGTMIDNITKEHENFKEEAPYAKFVIYIVFITIGVAAIFSQYPATLAVLQTLAWGLAIAMALMMVPVLIRLFKAEKNTEKKKEE